MRVNRNPTPYGVGFALDIQEYDRGNTCQDGYEFQCGKFFLKCCAGDDGHQYTDATVDHGIENGGGHPGV